MSKLKDLVGDRSVVRGDWMLLATAWGVQSDYTLQKLAPANVGCKLCWDWDICAECLGAYPDQCPNDCGDGTCPDHRLTLETARKQCEEIDRRFSRRVHGLYKEREEEMLQLHEEASKSGLSWMEVISSCK